MSSHTLGITGYVALLLIAAGLVALSHRSGGRVATAGQVVAAVRRGRVGRVLLALAWCWVGWHLFVR